MPEFVLTNQKLWIDGYDFSGTMNALQIEGQSDPKEATTFGNTAVVRKPGRRDVAMAHEGLFDADPFDQAIFDRIGGPASVVMTIGGVDGLAGDTAYSAEVMLADYSPGAAVGEMFAFGLSAQGKPDTKVALARCTVFNDAVRTTSGNNPSPTQLGPVGANQAVYAACHVLDVSGGGPTLDLIVESDDSAAMLSPTTQITFPQFTAIGAAARIAEGPITDDYWRIAWTIGGTTPSFDFRAVVGIVDIA